MAIKSAPLLLRALVEMHSSKVLQGSLAGSRSIRHLGSCGILASRRASLPLPPAATTSCPPSRTFLNLAAPLIARRMEYFEARLMGYSPEQMYDVVSNVDSYKHFVPWCKRSKVVRGHNSVLKAHLEIGFPPIVERYTSEVTVIPNHQVRAVCTDCSLFNHLETVWRFCPGPPDQPESCTVEFHVAFEFKSLLHSQLATVFFDEVVKQMVNAFEKRAAKLYGPQAIVQEKVALRRTSI